MGAIGAIGAMGALDALGVGAMGAVGAGRDVGFGAGIGTGPLRLSRTLFRSLKMADFACTFFLKLA